MMAGSKARTAKEIRERGQKQMAVLMVLVAIPIAYFLFLRGPIATYLHDRNEIAIATAEANQQSPLVRGDSETGAAVKRTDASLSAAELKARVEAAVANQSDAELVSVTAANDGTVSFTIRSRPEELAGVLASLQGDLRFEKGGQIRSSGPAAIVIETSSKPASVGYLESRVKIIATSGA